MNTIEELQSKVEQLEEKLEEYRESEEALVDWRKRLHASVVNLFEHIQQMSAAEDVPEALAGRLATLEEIGYRLVQVLQQLKVSGPDAEALSFAPSARDPVTGLFNRRYFTDVFEQEISRAKQHGTSLVLCLLDLDNFKTINETYGDPAGDMVLSQNGAMISGSVRQGDLVCRYGGDRFVIIMPNSHPEGARVLCERIRQRIAGNRFETEEAEFRITISAGISAYNSSVGQSSADLFSVAEGALRQAKQQGGDRVHVSGFMPMELSRPL
jgi:diguanylate cyclase (GGDEF)-like protein